MIVLNEICWGLGYHWGKEKGVWRNLALFGQVENINIIEKEYELDNTCLKICTFLQKKFLPGRKLILIGAQLFS